MNGLCDLCTPGTVRNSEDSQRFIHWWPSVVYCAMKDLMSTPVKTDHNLDFVDLTQDEQAPISASHRFHNFRNSTVSKQAVVVNVAAENRNSNIMWGCYSNHALGPETTTLTEFLLSLPCGMEVWSPVQMSNLHAAQQKAQRDILLAFPFPLSRPRPCLWVATLA